MKATKSDYLWNTVGVVLQNAISPLLLLIVTRVNGIEAAGVFSFAFAISLLLWALGMWGGRTYQVSDTQSEFEHRSYIMVRILLAFAMLAIAYVFCALNNYDAFKTGLILVLVLFKVLESLADVLYGVLQVNGKLYIGGRSLALKAALGLVIFGVIDWFTHNILISVLGIVVVNVVVLVMYDFMQANRVESIRFPAQKFKKYVVEAGKILRRCFGVFIIFFLAMFSLNIPRYFIDIYSQNEVGYFGIIAMPITLIVLLISFILQPNVLKLSKLYRAGYFSQFKKETSKIIGVSLAIGLIVLIGVELFGVQVLHLIFGVEFYEYHNALSVIVAGGIASALVTVYLNIFVIMRQISFALIVLVATNIILIPVSIVAVKTGGLLGGVWAFSVANVIQLLLVAGYFATYRKGVTIDEKA